MNRWQALKQRITLLFSGNKFLCDMCRYNYGNACWRPERPNAVRCPDFQRR